jgi:small subunit ribosomal protein S4
MSRYTGPIYRKSRRYGFSILETGKELAKKPTAPGMHGTGRGKITEYGTQLHEKQKVKFMYGLSEKQFKKTYDRAIHMAGNNGLNLLILLESRLDNIVYRLGLAKTRAAARQLVNHGHIKVNDIKVNIPSYQVKVGDTISIKEKSLNHPAIKESLENTISRVNFVSWDEKKMTGTYLRYPEREELNPDIKESTIVDFYNR